MKFKKQTNPYLVLKVSPQSNHKEIKQAYIKLAHIYHPDKNQGNKLAEKKFLQIYKAWQILKNPKDRKLFDKNFVKENATFKKAFSPSLKAKELQPTDLEVSLRVSVEELCLSKTKSIDYFRSIDGQRVRSSFNFSLPLGSTSRSRLIFKGKGGSEKGKKLGDLYIKLILLEHKLFKFKERSSDIFLNWPVSFLDVIEEKKIKILSPYGLFILKSVLSLEDNQILKIKSYGFPKNSKGHKGDLFVKIVIDYPKGLKKTIQQEVQLLSREEKKVYAKNYKKSWTSSKVLQLQKGIQEIKGKV